MYSADPVSELEEAELEKVRKYLNVPSRNLIWYRHAILTIWLSDMMPDCGQNRTHGSKKCRHSS